MKIGYFTSVRGWGGSETYLLRLMQGVRDCGHEVLLFGVAGSRLWEEAGKAGIPKIAWRSLEKAESRKQNSNLKMSVMRLKTFSLQPSTFNLQPIFKRLLLRSTPGTLKLLAGNIREVLQLWRLFKAHPVDVMHVSNSGYEVAGISCRLNGTPSLVMNMITPSDEISPARRFLMRFTMWCYDHVSSQSAYCTEQWRKLCHLKRLKVSHVWNGADLDTFLPINRSQRRSSRFRLVSLGRLHPMKGYRYLIEAMSMVTDCELTIYGEGSERAALEALIAKHDLQGKVFLPGHTESPEKVLQESDCFVLPSVSHESCPAVLAQAMACGLPLITSDFGPLAEINLSGQTGVLCAMHDAEALAQAINGLMYNKDRYAAMSKAAILRAAAFSEKKWSRG